MYSLEIYHSILNKIDNGFLKKLPKCLYLNVSLSLLQLVLNQRVTMLNHPPYLRRVLSDSDAGNCKKIL